MIRSYFKKAVAMFISFVMMITVFLTFPISYFTASAICCRKDGFDKLKYTLTGDMAKDVATIAKSQKGRTCDQFGYSGVDYGLWCDEFVADCLENAGADSSIVGHGGTVANFETIMRKKGAKPVSSPQTGDLVFFTSSHVEIVTKVSNGVVYSAGGNNGSYPGMCQGEHVVSNARLYLRPKYPNKKYTLSIHYNANGGTVASDSNYYIGSNNDLYRKSDNKLMGPTWEDGYKDPDGLVNASTLKLTKSGYTFLGWSLQKSGGKIYDQNDSTVSANDLYPNITKQNGTVMLYAQWAKCGHVMSENEGAGQTIPDGDYWIVNGLSTRYLVDISGDNYNTTNGTNLKMHLWNTNNWGEYDVFTVKYLNNGFYSITQRTTNMTVNVESVSLLSGSNVHMWEKNNSTAAQWSIKRTANGYTLQARCSGYYLDVEGGKTDNCNLQVYEGNGTKSQMFSFVPYNAGKPIQNGVYRIGTIRGKGAYIDAAGESGEYKNGTNIQIWDAGADNYFRFEYCKNGFYKIYDNVSGLALDVYNPNKTDYLGQGTNVQLYKDKDTLGQYWAIKSAGNGYYYIISKLNGYYLDLNRGKTTNDTNIQIWQGFGDNQKWSFVTNKELSVTAPSKTIYYVGEELDTTGMIVKMTYSDGYSMDVTKNVELSCDLLTVGTKNVTVTYEQGGLKSTANFSITVKEKEVTTTITSTTTTVPITTTTSATTTALTTTTSSTTTTMPIINPKPIEDFDLIMRNGEQYTIEIEQSNLIFKSNNTDVAVVSKSGVITALTEGDAVITIVMPDGETAQVHLTVIPVNVSVSGDVNADGEFDVADVILLQKWLLAVLDTHLADWQAADLCEDGKLDVFDLCLMKRKLINAFREE